MSNKGKTFNQTIKTLDDLKGRCVIDDITGCWLFRSGESSKRPRVYFVHPLTGQKLVSSLPRAAWLLAGNPEPEKGQKAYRYACMCDQCANPEHLRVGTSKQLGACVRKHGKDRGKPERAAVNQRNSAKRRKLTPEQVEIVRSSDKSGVQLAREFGISHNAISQIRLGRTYRGGVVSLASVFTWRPAA